MSSRPAWLSGHAPAAKPSQHHGFWNRNREVLSWAAPTSDLLGPEAGVIWRTSFGTPLFDLRPDIDAVGGPYSAKAVPIQRSTMVGIAFQLSIRVICSRSWGVFFPADVRNGLTPLRVTALEFSDPTEPSDVYALAPGETEQGIAKFTTNPVDITSAFWSGNKDAGFYSVSLAWSPSGPVKYWGLALVFDLLAPEGTALPSLWPSGWQVSASMH